MELGASNDRVLSMMEKSDDPIVLLNVGLSRWFEQTSRRPTLVALATALRSKAVGETEKASDIVKGKQFVLTYMYSYEYCEEPSRTI